MDILAGVVNVFCLFYVLYARRMFKLTLLVSKGSCYMIAAVCSLTLFSNIAFPLYRFLRTNFQFEETTGILLISVIFFGCHLVDLSTAEAAD